MYACVGEVLLRDSVGVFVRVFFFTIRISRLFYVSRFYGFTLEFLTLVWDKCECVRRLLTLFTINEEIYDNMVV